MDGDRFHCDKLHCELSKAICIRRQEMAEQPYGTHQECINCEQGTQIRGGNGMGDIALKCRVEGCNNSPIKARWMCQKHYDEWYQNGKKPEELPEGYGERRMSIKPRRSKKAVKAAKAPAPKNGKALSYGKHAPKSITQFVDGLMATVRREVIAELRGEINQAFDRLGRA